MRSPCAGICALALWACAPEVHADCNAAAGGHGRWYADEAATHAYEGLASLSAELTCSYQQKAGTVALKVFGRAAQHDSQLSHWDVRELRWTYARDSFLVTAGWDQVFWGVMEFAHIVDVVNQADVLEDPFGEVKLGQPMLRAALRRNWGSIEAFALPRFRKREFPALGEPMRAAPPVALGPARFQSGSGQEHADWAVRYSIAKGPIDLGLTYFDGTARDPDFIEPIATPRGIVVAPYYALIEQVGVDLQLTSGEWLLKFEGARRSQSGRPTSEGYAVGLEYAFISIAGTAADLTIAAEYARDRRTPPPVPGFLERDWAIGLRLAFNDARSTEGRLGLIQDRAHGSQAWAFELASRLTDRWKLALEARVFRDVARTDPLRVLHSDSYLDVSMTRYF